MFHVESIMKPDMNVKNKVYHLPCAAADGMLIALEAEVIASLAPVREGLLLALGLPHPCIPFMRYPMGMDPSCVTSGPALLSLIVTSHLSFALLPAAPAPRRNSRSFFSPVSRTGAPMKALVSSRRPVASQTRAPDDLR